MNKGIALSFRQILFLGLILIAANSKAYICADYVALTGFTALANNDCLDITLVEAKRNPHAKREEYREFYTDQFLSPLENKLGGWILTNDHKLNRLWLEWNYNPQFELRGSDLDYITKVAKKNYIHLKMDLYREASVFLAKRMISGNPTPYHQKVFDYCLESSFPSSKETCGQAAVNSYHKTLGPLIIGLLEKDHFQVYQVIAKSLKSSKWENNLESALTQKLLKYDFINEQGILKNLPFTLEDHRTPLYGVYASNGNVQLATNQLAVLQKMNYYRFTLSKLLQFCFEKNCKLKGDFLSPLTTLKVEETAYALESIIKFLKLELNSPLLNFFMPETLNTFLNFDESINYIKAFERSLGSDDGDSFIPVATEISHHLSLILGQIVKDEGTLLSEEVNSVSWMSEKPYIAAGNFSKKFDRFGFLPPSRYYHERWNLLKNVGLRHQRPFLSNQMKSMSPEKGLRLILELGHERSFQFDLIKDQETIMRAFNDLDSTIAALTNFDETVEGLTIDAYLGEIL